MANNLKLNLRGRLSYEHVFDPKAPDEKAEPVFSANLLLAKDDPQLAKIKAAMVEVAEAKWGSRGKANLETLIKNNRVALKDGDEKEWGGYEGMMYLSASNKVRPLVIDRDKSLLTKADGKVYSGCYVNMLVEIWAMDNKFGKRICATLKGVQFVADGEAFTGGKPASTDDFEDVADTGDEGDDLWA